MEQTNYLDSAENTITTEDFSQSLMDNIFSGKGSFSDDNDDIKSKVTTKDDVDEVDYEFKNEHGAEYDPSTDGVIDPLDDVSDLMPTDYIEANELADFVAVNGERVEREVIEKALNAYGGVKEWGNNLNSHFEELDALEENINKMYSLANSEINVYIEQLEGVVNNDRYDAVKRMEAYKQLQAYQAQKAGIEKSYSENFDGIKARKASAEQLKGQTVSNELVAMGWKQNDFQTTANFMISNDIRLAAKDVSSSLMIALKKAALYDAGKNKLKEETKSNVQKAITGTAQRKSNVVAPEDSRRKAKAAQMAKDGTLSSKDAFEFLID